MFPSTVAPSRVCGFERSAAVLNFSSAEGAEPAGIASASAVSAAASAASARSTAGRRGTAGMWPTLGPLPGEDKIEKRRTLRARKMFLSVHRWVACAEHEAEGGQFAAETCARPRTGCNGGECAEAEQVFEAQRAAIPDPADGPEGLLGEEQLGVGELGAQLGAVVAAAVVDDGHHRQVAHVPARRLDPEAPVLLLGVEEEALVEAADLVERLAAHREEGPDQPVHRTLVPAVCVDRVDEPEAADRAQPREVERLDELPQGGGETPRGRLQRAVRRPVDHAGRAHGGGPGEGPDPIV